MTQRFLLGGVVLFIPGRNLLIAAEDDSTQLSLSNPASQCLALLIQHHDQVVEREYFFQQVWLNNGAQVTNNNFYQNISLLRRAFKEFGLNDDLIITVPKVGIRLAAELEVTRCDNAVDTPPEPVVRATPVAATQKPPVNRIWPVALGISLAGLTGLFFLWRSEFEPRLQRYVPIGAVGECHIYGNPEAADYRAHQQFIQQNSPDCQHYPWIYLTLYPNVQRTAALRCRQQYSPWRDNQCVTSYYLGDIPHVGS